MDTSIDSITVARLPNEVIEMIFREIPIAVLSAMYWEYCWHSDVCPWANKLRIFLYEYFCNLKEFIDEPYEKDQDLNDEDWTDWWEPPANPTHTLYRFFVNPLLIRKLETSRFVNYHNEFINLEELKIKNGDLPFTFYAPKLKNFHAVGGRIFSTILHENCANLTHLHLEDIYLNDMTLRPFFNSNLQVLTLINLQYESTRQIDETELTELLDRHRETLVEFNCMETRHHHSWTDNHTPDILYFICNGLTQFPNLRKIGGNIHHSMYHRDNTVIFPPKLVCLELCLETGEIILYRWEEICNFQGNIVLRGTKYWADGFIPFFNAKCIATQPPKGRICILPLDDKAAYERCLNMPYFTKHEIVG